MNNELVSRRFLELNYILSATASECEVQILKAAELLISVIRTGNKLMICGNGGSAADSQHFAAELVSAFSRKISRSALPAIALTTDSSIITAYSNDFGFEGIFARQVEAIGSAGDVLIAISTSGSSQNCLLAVEKAKSLGIKSIAMTRKRGKIATICDLSIEIPSDNTQHIQEAHMAVYHILSELIEDSISEI